MVFPARAAYTRPPSGSSGRGPGAEKASAAAREVFADRKVIAYAVALADATRHPGRYGLHALEPLIEYGASPRGPIGLVQAARRWRSCAAAATP